MLAWSSTTSLNHKVMIWWGFFRQTAPATVPEHIGADSLKKPHHIVTLRFSEVVKDHTKNINQNNILWRTINNMCSTSILSQVKQLTFFVWRINGSHFDYLPTFQLMLYCTQFFYYISKPYVECPKYQLKSLTVPLILFLIP